MPKAGEPVMRQVGRVIYQTCRLTLALPKNAHPRLTFALPNLICLLSCATAFLRGGFNVQASKKTTAAWIAVVSRDASISVSMARAIESRLFVKGFASTDLLETAVCNSVPFAIVVDVGNWAQKPEFAALRRLRSLAPQAPIVCLCDRATAGGLTLSHAFESGATSVLFRDEIRTGPAVRDALNSVYGDGVSTRLATTAGLRLTVIGARVLRYCIESAQTDLTVSELARHFRLTRDALASQLYHAGLPSPRRLIMWTKLLLAATLIEQSNGTLERIALGLGLSGASSLSRAFQHYACLRPARVPQQLIFRKTADAFASDCNAAPRHWLIEGGEQRV